MAINFLQNIAIQGTTALAGIFAAQIAYSVSIQDTTRSLGQTGGQLMSGFLALAAMGQTHKIVEQGSRGSMTFKVANALGIPMDYTSLDLMKDVSKGTYYVASTMIGFVHETTKSATSYLISEHDNLEVNIHMTNTTPVESIYNTPSIDIAVADESLELTGGISPSDAILEVA